MFLFFFISFFLIWGFLIFFYLSSKEKSFSKEILWKAGYFLASFVIFLSICFEYSENILLFLTTLFKEHLILKDPQDLSILLYEVICFLGSIFVLVLLILIVYSYIINAIFYQDEFALKYYVSLIIYFLILSFIFINWDIFFSIRQLYDNLIYKNIDIQTDFYLLFLIYIGEFYDILVFLSLLIILHFLFFKSRIAFKINNLNQKVQIMLHRFLICTISFCFLYFFGGDGLLSTIIIILSSLFFFEIWVFIWFFMKILYKKKF